MFSTRLLIMEPTDHEGGLFFYFMGTLHKRGIYPSFWDKIKCVFEFLRILPQTIYKYIIRKEFKIDPPYRTPFSPPLIILYSSLFLISLMPCNFSLKICQ